MLRAAGGLALDAGTTQAFASALNANQSVVPSSGDTVVMTQNNLDGLLMLNPGATLAALTVTPPENNVGTPTFTARPGQETLL